MTNNVSLALVATEREDVKELEHRILTLLPGADRIPPQVRLMVAQAALVYGLDPFLNEIMAIPQLNKRKEVVGWSLYTGIRGMRKAARNSRQAKYLGRYLAPLNDTNAKEFFGMAAQEVCQANGLKPKEDIVWVCAVFLEGSPQPFVELGVVGPGFPYYGRAPLFKMAKKRAEHAALCAACDLPFGLSDEVNGDGPEGVKVISPSEEALPSEEDRPALAEEVVEGEYGPAPAESGPEAEEKPAEGSALEEQAEPGPEEQAEPIEEEATPQADGNKVRQMRAHFRQLAADSPLASDPASGDMVRSLRVSLDRRYGEGAAGAIARAVFGVISLEEVTKAQAIAMQNELGTGNGRWAEAVEAILAGAGQPEEPEPAEDSPMDDPVIQAAVNRYGAQVAGVEPPAPQQGELPLSESEVDVDDAFADLGEDEIPF